MASKFFTGRVGSISTVPKKRVGFDGVVLPEEVPEPPEVEGVGAVPAAGEEGWAFTAASDTSSAPCGRKSGGAWLIACYGPRLEAVSLTLEGFHRRRAAYHGILPWVARGQGETRDTLPLREVRDLAEGVFNALFPQIRFDRATAPDIHDVARSGRIAAVRVPANRQVELLQLFRRPEKFGDPAGPDE